MITLVGAKSRNNAIGKDGGLPWRIPGELKFFQQETIGSALIMGRETWNSLPRKPLQGRLNLILSSQASQNNQALSPEAENVLFVSGIQEAIDYARSLNYVRISGIGGERVFREMLPFADRMVITDVDMTVEDADAFFPNFDRHSWDQVATGKISMEPVIATWRELRRIREWKS